MKNKYLSSLLLSHLILAVLVGTVLFATKSRQTVRAPDSMLAGLVVIEFLFLVRYNRTQKKKKKRGACDIILFIWIVILVWELVTSVLSVTNPVLVPCPENVFDTFRLRWKSMLLNVAYSMELLSIGFLTGMILAVLLGLVVGWIPRLRSFAYPIANVMAPIPAIVFSPYLVSIMPSFRSASVTVIILGVFWPSFLTTINRVSSIDSRILDSARMLNLRNTDMILNILLPYVLPGVVSGLRVSVTTSVLMLNFAELMGATHGMGYYIQNSITYANYTQAVAGIICIGIVVTILSRIVTVIQNNAIRWR